MPDRCPPKPSKHCVSASSTPCKTNASDLPRPPASSAYTGPPSDGGYTPQKAARRAYERDPAAVRRWLEHDYPRLVEQAAAEGAEIHWLDESSLRSDSALGKH
jgi:hypothetical protein